MNWLGDNTALHEAAKGGHIDTVELLINKGADIHQKDQHGKNVHKDIAIYLPFYLSIISFKQ